MARDGEGFTNYYDVLGVPMTANTKAIRMAYFKKAKALHPDKNPDNPERAAKLFDAVKKAYDALNDAEQRAKLDKKLQARLLEEKRFQEANAEKRKLMAELRKREAQAAQAAKTQRQAAWVQADITRLRASGAALQEAMERELEAQADATRAKQAAQREAERVARLEKERAAGAAMRAQAAQTSTIDSSVRVKWRSKLNEELGGRMDKEELARRFGVFGAVREIVRKKTKSAVVVFGDTAAAQQAVAQGVPGFVVAPVALADASTVLGRQRRETDRLKARDFASAGGGDPAFSLRTGGRKRQRPQDEVGAGPATRSVPGSNFVKHGGAGPRTLDGIEVIDEEALLAAMEELGAPP